jgi:hypothetical protein
MKFNALMALWTTLLLTSIAEAVPLPPWLEAGLNRVALDASRQGRIAFAIADLDETLIDSAPRRYLSLQEAIEKICAPLRSRLLECSRARGINLQEIYALPNRYDFGPLFQRLGLEGWAARHRLIDRMLDVYLGDTHLDQDQAIPGAVELALALRERAIPLFFVSSRYEDTQRAGTIASLKKLGLLRSGEEDHVILRPRAVSSIDFKTQAFKRVGDYEHSRGGMIGLILENEPENMNALTTLYPEAFSVFVEGARLVDASLQSASVRVRGFR